jgi:hypothetical protein
MTDFTIFIPLLVCLVGLALYFLTKQRPKAEIIAHDMWVVGLLATLLSLGRMYLSIHTK